MRAEVAPVPDESRTSRRNLLRAGVAPSRLSSGPSSLDLQSRHRSLRERLRLRPQPAATTMAKKVKALFRREGSSVWEYDFVVKGTRHVGTTRLSNQRAAEQMVQEMREKAKRTAAEDNGTAVMRFGTAADRWFEERAKHRKDVKDMARTIAWLKDAIGIDTPLSKIDNNVVARVADKRRSQGVSNSSVNRSALEPLRALLRRAEVWGQPTARIQWGAHLLKEPQERIRELTVDEEKRLFAALREDFHPLARFLLITGVRRAEGARLEWRNVDLEGERMIVHGKGGTVLPVPLPMSAIEVLEGEKGKHPDRVFTYVVKNAWGGDVGTNKPIEPDTFSTAFWRARRKAGIVDFRPHDLRHSAATRARRSGADLLVVKKMLRHADIASTARYAHVTDDDLRHAMNKAAPAKSPEKLPSFIKNAGQIQSIKR